jgi:hypothetical protein
MARGSYRGGSTIIRTGNAKISSNGKKKVAGEKRSVIGYILHKGSSDRYLSVHHGKALVENGSCKETGVWQGFVSIEYK